MVIPVNEKYRIASDRNAWMVQERSVVKGEERWESLYWYAELGYAIRGLSQLQVREIPDSVGVKEIVVRMKEIEEEIKLALYPFRSTGENGGNRSG